MAEKKWKANKTYFIIGIIFALIIGIVIGLIVEQIIIVKGIEKAGESLEGIVSEMNIEIDLNETKIVEATYKRFPGEFNDTK